MAKETKDGAPAANAVALTPRQQLQATLVAIAMASKRFPPEQAWMKDAIISALNARLEPKVEALTDEQVEVVADALAWAK